MKRTRAYTLVLAIVLTGAFGVTIGVLGSHFTGTVREARSSELEIRADQLLASGQAWLAAHPDALKDLDRPIELPVEDLLPSGSRGSLVIRSVNAGAGAEIEAVVRHGAAAARLRVVVNRESTGVGQDSAR